MFSPSGEALGNGTGDPRDPSRRVIVLLFLAVLFVYGQTWSFDFINMDDPAYVRDNLHVLSGLSADGILWAFTTKACGYWQPITWLSLQGDVSLFGPAAGPHHLVNVLFHACNSALLFILLFRKTRDLVPSAFTALLFAIHPVQVESVAWITERKDVLSTFFFMLTSLAYVKHLETGAPRHRLAVLGFFLLGLMSKPMLVTLPLALTLLDVWPLGRVVDARTLWASTRSKAGLYALSLGFGLLTLEAQSATGAVSGLESLPLLQRLFQGLSNFYLYASSLVWPRNLAVFYPYHHRESAYLPLECLGLAAGLALTTWALVRLSRNHSVLWVGWAWFLVTLVPVIGFLQAGAQARADRFTYLPSIGLFMALAWTVHAVGVEIPRLGKGLMILASGACTCLGILAFRQVTHWRSNLTLFEHALKVTESNYLAHGQVGYSYLEAGNPRKAAFHLFEATRIKPDQANNFYLLGIAQFQLGELPQANASLRRARDLRGSYRYLDYWLGETAFAQDRFQEAIPPLENFLAREGPQATGFYVAKARTDLEACRQHLSLP